MASDRNTINPIICRVLSGLSFKFLSQTMAGHIPTGLCQVFQGDGESQGPNWPPVATAEESPLKQGGSLGTSQGPGAPPWEVLAPKAGSCGRWEGTRLEAENLGFQEPGLPRLPLGPWQLTRSCVWAAGADGSVCIWGRKGGGKPPPPSQLPQNPRCRGSCWSLVPHSCCLSVSMATRPKD